MENSKFQNSSQHQNTQDSVIIATSADVQQTKIPTNKIRPRKVINRCKICYKAFRNPAVFRAHVYLHKKNEKTDKKRSFLCRICDTSHLGLTAFVGHQINHHAVSKHLNSELIDTADDLFNQHHSQTPTEVIITTTTDVGGALQLSDHQSEEEVRHSTDQNDISTLDGNMVTQAETLQAGILPLPASAVSLMAALCSAATQSTTHTTNNTATISAAGSNCKTVSSTDGVQIEIPSQVKAIYLNSANPGLGDVQRQLNCLNSKIDCLIKHLNIPVDAEGNPVPMATATIAVAEKLSDCDDENAAVMLENFPPSYSVVQAAKEQQQQEYYALTLSNRQAQQVFKTDSTHILSSTPSELKSFQKGKSVDLWVPSHQYLSQLTTLSEPSQEQDEIASSIISQQVIDKVFVESRSRANFAKNLTFAIFTAEERRDRNCTGRVFGKARHKGQLDPIKLQAVKDATFRKYPCAPNLIDMTWRKECVTAIDSGLRNENRGSVKCHQDPLDHLPHHHHHVDDSNMSDESITKM